MSDALGGVKGGVCLVACLIVSTGVKVIAVEGWALVRCRWQATEAERGHARSSLGCRLQNREPRTRKRSPLR